MAEEKVRIRLPGEGELLGKVVELVGDDRARVVCQDGMVRIARIPGRYRKKMWVRAGDVVIVVPWDFDPKKADIIHRYERNEVNDLRELGFSGILDRLDELAF